MASINELLESLGVEEDLGQEKTASSEKEIEKAAVELGLISDETSLTKEASTNRNGGTHMELQDLYNDYFGEEVVKTASASAEVQTNGFDKEASSALEQEGAIAGVEFSNNLYGRLLKFAAELMVHDEPESSATQSRDGAGAQAVAGGNVDNPQLPVSVAPNRDKKMSTDPQYYDMLDAAIAKKAIEKALEENDTSNVEGVHSVDTGLETPDSQANA